MFCVITFEKRTGIWNHYNNRDRGVVIRQPVFLILFQHFRSKIPLNCPELPKNVQKCSTYSCWPATKYRIRHISWNIYVCVSQKNPLNVWIWRVVCRQLILNRTDAYPYRKRTNRPPRSCFSAIVRSFFRFFSPIELPSAEHRGLSKSEVRIVSWEMDLPNESKESKRVFPRCKYYEQKKKNEPSIDSPEHGRSNGIFGCRMNIFIVQPNECARGCWRNVGNFESLSHIDYSSLFFRFVS